MAKKRGRPRKGCLSPTEREKRKKTKMFNPSGRGRPYKNAFKCPHCDKGFTDRNSMLAHSISCPSNPNSARNKQKRKQVLLQKYQNWTQYPFTLHCRRCGKEYIRVMNQYDFEHQKYNTYCSSKCRFDRPQEDYFTRSYTPLKRIISLMLSLNALKSNTLTSFRAMKFSVIRICPQCKAQFLTKSVDKVYCSKECKQKASFFIRKKQEYLEIIRPLRVGISGWYGGRKS